MHFSDTKISILVSCMNLALLGFSYKKSSLKIAEVRIMFLSDVDEGLLSHQNRTHSQSINLDISHQIVFYSILIYTSLIFSLYELAIDNHKSISLRSS